MQDSWQARGASRAGWWLMLGSLVALWPATAQGQPLRDLVDEVLDQKIENIQIDNVPLPEALTRLGDKTGLAFVMDPVAMEWMPYGERTRVSIDLRDISVRQGLRRMFDGLGLAMRLDADKIRVEPAPVLDRLGRRMTIDEVHLLGSLAARTWSELPADSRRIQARGFLQGDPQKALEELLAKVQAPNALQQLEAAATQLGWCWVPQDGAILIYPRSEDVRNRLNRVVDLDYQRVTLADVLTDLGNRVGVNVAFQPGVLGRIQAGRRTLDFVQHGTTVRQALERICGSAGITFETSDDGVRISLPPGVPTSMPAGRVVAILRVPVGKDGTSVEFPFYEDNLPPEFGRLLDQKLPIVLEELRRHEGQ